MNFGNFRQYVADFLKIPSVTDTNIANFTNMGKLRLQRKHDFMFTRTDSSNTYPSTADEGIALPSSFKAITEPLAVRLISSGSEVPLTGDSLTGVRRRWRDTRFGQVDASGIVQSVVDVNKLTSLDITYYVQVLTTGTVLWTYPEQLGQTINVEYFAWLNDYTQDTEEDFLLLRGYDMLLWEVLKVANTFLAEENRVLIDSNLMEEAFQNFTEWDKLFANQGAFVELD